MRQPFFCGKQMESFSPYTANVLLAAIAYCADRFHRFPFFLAAQVLADLSAAEVFSTAPSPPGISAQYHQIVRFATVNQCSARCDRILTDENPLRM